MIGNGAPGLMHPGPTQAVDLLQLINGWTSKNLTPGKLYVLTLYFFGDLDWNKDPLSGRKPFFQPTVFKFTEKMFEITEKMFETSIKNPLSTKENIFLTTLFLAEFLGMGAPFELPPLGMGAPFEPAPLGMGAKKHPCHWPKARIFFFAVILLRKCSKPQ